MAEHNHVVNKEGEVALNKVDDVLNRIDDNKRMTFWAALIHSKVI